jgi:hypothetical protein
MAAIGLGALSMTPMELLVNEIRALLDEKPSRALLTHQVRQLLERVLKVLQP